MSVSVIGRILEGFLGPAKASGCGLLRFSQKSLFGGDILYFVFLDRSAIPSWVVRLPRDLPRGEDMAREMKTYGEIHRRARGQPGLPARRLIHDDGLPAIVEEFLPGGAINRGAAREADLQGALAWLGNFQERTKSGIWEGQRLGSEFESLLEAFARTCSLGRGVADGAREIVRSVLRSESRPLPCVAEHGDFSGYNILVRRRQIQVVDWQWCRLASEPFQDALFLVLTDAVSRTDLSLHPQGVVKRFRDAFIGESRPTSRVARLLAGYLMQTDYPPAWLPLSFTILLLSRALREAGLPAAERHAGPDYATLFRMFVEHGGALPVWGRVAALVAKRQPQPR